MAVRGLVVEKFGSAEQDDESTENIDMSNLGIYFSIMLTIYKDCKFKGSI